MESVRETYNYQMFNFGSWNRDVKEKNLKRLDARVKEEGWKKHPIIVNKNYDVIDGQHRLVYAKQHHLPVYYIVVEELTSRDCVLMNNSRVSWSLEDYIKLHASEGNENYIRLQEMLNNYNFAPVSTLTNLMKGLSGGGKYLSIIKDGNFKITSKECRDLKAKFDFLQELSPYVKSAKGRCSAIYMAIAFCYDLDGISKARLKKQVKNRIAMITPPADIDMAFKEIEHIYNYKIAREDYVYIHTEYKKHAKQQMLKGAQATQEAFRLRKEKSNGR